MNYGSAPAAQAMGFPAPARDPELLTRAKPGSARASEHSYWQFDNSLLTLRQ
ncbi:DUF5953 family protein [Hyalangium versicolor]|uniref:DUF5953 family protein n=1 Tax=Hyalangium versicolor TaxID=2861190 RepID=UPI001CCCE471|nr:DUF5953 family protein [Hyalangium versicolor]